MSYKSPIEIWYDDNISEIASQITEHSEMQIMAQINQHVSVDKEELIKALNYDRQQYEKGYADAKTEYQRPQGEWKEVTKGIDSNTYECPFCGRLINCDRPRLKLYPFCHCGADMRGDENE